MERYILYVDGGGTATSPCYFSYSGFSETGTKKLTKLNQVQLNKFWLSNLSLNLLPPNCSLRTEEGLMSNNIAEYCACYFGLLRFQEIFGGKEVTIFQDSQLVVNQVNGVWSCEKKHLVPWQKAVQNLRHNRVFLQWVKREVIVNVLGH